MSTDPDFWKIFKLQFLDGKSFTEAERGGDMQSVVISASVARKLFGTTEAAGRQMLLNREVVRIIGVVKDISVTAKDAYAQVWSMYHSNELNVTGWWSYNGNRTIAVLARTPDDFPCYQTRSRETGERRQCRFGTEADRYYGTTR